LITFELFLIKVLYIVSERKYTLDKTEGAIKNGQLKIEIQICMFGCDNITRKYWFGRGTFIFAILKENVTSSSD